MEENLIKQRIYELTQKEHLDSASNEILFKQYALDKLNNIPLDQSEARTLLIMGNERLVFKTLHDTFGIYEFDKSLDEYSVGMIGLIRAVDTFNVDKNVSFTTYAIQVIANQVRMEYRKLAKHHRLQNLSSSINEPIIISNDGNTCCLAELLGEQDNTINSIIHDEVVEMVQYNLKYLTEAERLSIIYSYGLFGNPKLTQNQIAKKVGVNQAYVSRTMRTGYKKLRILSTPNEELSLKDLVIKQKLLAKSEEIDNIESVAVNCLKS